MLRLITAATALTVLVACDSEGIDQVSTVAGPVTGTVILDDDPQSGAEATDSGTASEAGATADSGNTCLLYTS